jgi:GTPase SAR1 family protein
VQARVVLFALFLSCFHLFFRTWHLYTLQHINCLSDPESMMVQARVAQSNQDKDELFKAIQEAMQDEGGPLGFGRLNIVGQGRSGKTALVRALQGLKFEDTESTCGVDQHLMEVRQRTIGVQGETGVWQLAEKNQDISVEQTAAILATRKVSESQGGPSKGLILHQEESTTEFLMAHLSKDLSCGDGTTTEMSAIITPKQPAPLSDTPAVAFDKDLVLQLAKDCVELHLKLWDFGGQEVFYALHHLYLTRFAAYAVLFNMKVRVLGIYKEYDGYDDSVVITLMLQS